MKKQLYFVVFIIFFFLVILLWWQHQSRHKSAIAHEENHSAKITNEPLIPLSESPDLDERKVSLGKKLFNDTQLSRDNSISCASCHAFDKGGTDQSIVPVGIDGQKGSINTPTVFNSSLNFKQFWDGRANTLEEQVDGPTHASNEMGSNWAEIIRKLNNSQDYVRIFKEIYPDGIQSKNIKDAIATFERSLITTNSPFDRYLLGDSNAITDEEKEGYRLFKEYGCTSCHQGVNVGGNLFQRFGVMGDYFEDRGNITKADMGRYNVTGKETDMYVFKVPSLRNVGVTKPYFHDGSALELEDAVTVMSVYQLGRPLTAEETSAIVKFLRSLTGEYKGKSL